MANKIRPKTRDRADNESKKFVDNIDGQASVSVVSDSNDLRTLIEIQIYSLLLLDTSKLLYGEHPSDLLTDENGKLIEGE